MTEVESTFALLLLLLKGRKQGKILATFIQRIARLLQTFICCLSFGKSVNLFHPVCNNNSGGAVCLQTYIGSIVASVNPYKSIPGLYDRTAVERYSKHHMGEIAPHIFAVANECYRCLWKRHDNQCILIR